VVDGAQCIHSAVHILAYEQVRRVHPGILDADRPVASLRDRRFNKDVPAIVCSAR
jgi:hypothetical protein